MTNPATVLAPHHHYRFELTIGSQLPRLPFYMQHLYEVETGRITNWAEYVKTLKAMTEAVVAITETLAVRGWDIYPLEEQISFEKQASVSDVISDLQAIPDPEWIVEYEELSLIHGEDDIGTLKVLPFDQEMAVTQLRALGTEAQVAQYRVRHLAVVGGKEVGRNDPCPCGSGKKFKQCCGKWR